MVDQNKNIASKTTAPTNPNSSQTIEKIISFCASGILSNFAHCCLTPCQINRRRQQHICPVMAEILDLLHNAPDLSTHKNAPYGKMTKKHLAVLRRQILSKKFSSYKNADQTNPGNDTMQFLLIGKHKRKHKTNP